jgi:hypothetical protein
MQPDPASPERTGATGLAPPFDLLANSTICTTVKGIQLSRPELAFIIATRAMVGAGIALLLADRLSAEQRKAVGSTLVLVGLVTTIPAVWAIFGECE